MVKRNDRFISNIRDHGFIDLSAVKNISESKLDELRRFAAERAFESDSPLDSEYPGDEYPLTDELKNESVSIFGQAGFPSELVMAKSNKKLPAKDNISTSWSSGPTEFAPPPADLRGDLSDYALKPGKMKRATIGSSMRHSQEKLKTPNTPSEVEDLDWLKESFSVFISQEPIIIYAISIDKEQKENNQANSIRCFGGIAFGGYAHDVAKDSYLVQCVEYLQLGNLPFSFVITIPSAGNWKAKIPAPEKVVEKYFSPEQRKQLEMYREKYKAPKYEVQFIQMLGCDF